MSDVIFGRLDGCNGTDLTVQSLIFANPLGSGVEDVLSPPILVGNLSGVSFERSQTVKRNVRSGFVVDGDEFFQ